MALEDDGSPLEKDSHFAYLAKEYADRHAGHGCPLEDAAYYNQLYASAKRCIDKAGSSISRPSSTVALLYTRMMCENCFSSGVGDLYDLHEEIWGVPIMINMFSVEVSASVADELLKSLPSTSSTSDLHFVLWCAIHSYLDAEPLSRLLDFHMDECILSTSLLPLAAYLLNDDAVNLLLIHGAQPDKTDVLFHTLRYLPLEKLLAAGPTNPWNFKLTNTIRLLLGRGAYLVPIKGKTANSSNQNNPSIFFVVTLASHGLLNSADLMMTAALKSDLNYQPEENSFNGYQPRTVLTLALIAFKQRFFVNPVPERFLLSLERHGRTRSLGILKNIILPALKSGAILPRDPLDFGHSRTDDWFNYYRSLTLLPEYAPALRDVNDAWLSYYIRILLETRMTSALNVPAFKHFIEQHRTRFHERELQFGNAILKSELFPRSLQNQCRTKLLRDCLPGGLHQRAAALGSLHLPGCVEDYLKFSEFDLPLRQLEIIEKQGQLTAS